jgi:N-sulfoglucosamine sulfohydrolase
MNMKAVYKSFLHRRKHYWNQLAMALLGLIVASNLPLLAVPRNVVLFVSDDHGQDTGCYGNPDVKTPNLDSLAAGGTMFTHAFATTASCSASRSVILTGLYNHRNGQYGHMHDYHHFRSFSDIKSLPVLLREKGYRTASAGKFHVAPEEVYQFEQYIPGSARNPVEMALNARDFIAADERKPFFLYFCTSDPHRGGGVVESSRHRPDRFGNRPDGYDGIQETVYAPEDLTVPKFLPDNSYTRAELAQYYQSVSRVDQGVGKLIEILKESGVFEDTLFIYISDHGMAFPGAKTTAYEPGLRSPCLVRNPYAAKRGVRNHAMITWADLTPTILEFTGSEEPTYEPHAKIPIIRKQLADRHGLHGRSFLSILEEENPSGWDEVFASHTFHEIQMYYPMRVVRRRDFKLIWNIAHPLAFPFASDLWASATWQAVYQEGPEALYGQHTVKSYIHRPEFELYDLRTDPYESHNLAEDPAHAGVLEELKKSLEEFQKRTADPWILKWQYE